MKLLIGYCFKRKFVIVGLNTSNSKYLGEILSQIRDGGSVLLSVTHNVRALK